MLEAKMICRECKSRRVGKVATVALDIEVNDRTALIDTQNHVDLKFKARCGDCFSCDWEVTEATQVSHEEDRNKLYAV